MNLLETGHTTGFLYSSLLPTAALLAQVTFKSRSLTNPPLSLWQVLSSSEDVQTQWAGYLNFVKRTHP